MQQPTKEVGSNPTPRTYEQTLGISKVTSDTQSVSKILNVLLHLRKQGYRDSTLEAMGRKLRSIAKSGTYPILDDPEKVKEYVANLDCSHGHKGNLINAYDHYARYYKIPFDKPSYNRVDKIQRVPREEDINKVIAHARPRYALAYSILRDTGMRPVELSWLRLKQIDLENGRIYPSTAKHGSARALMLRPSTLAMLKKYVATRRVATCDTRLWPSRKRLTENWCRLSNSVAKKLGEPRIANIRLYDLRHHYATLLYCKTKDILHVQRMLGHRNIANTLRYIGLVDLDAETYIVKASTKIQESTELLEKGFEYVGPMHGLHVFRKPKTPFFSLFRIRF